MSTDEEFEGIFVFGEYYKSEDGLWNLGLVQDSLTNKKIFETTRKDAEWRLNDIRASLEEVEAGVNVHCYQLVEVGAN